MADAVIGTGIPHLGIGGGAEGHAQYIQRLHAVMGVAAGVRRFGVASLDLAYVAAGRFDGFWERGLKPWDVAAGVVLIREAGGCVSDSQGRSFNVNSPDLVAANGPLHPGLKKLLKAAG